MKYFFPILLIIGICAIYANDSVHVVEPGESLWIIALERLMPTEQEVRKETEMLQAINKLPLSGDVGAVVNGKYKKGVKDGLVDKLEPGQILKTSKKTAEKKEAVPKKDATFNAGVFRFLDLNNDAKDWDLTYEEGDYKKGGNVYYKLFAANKKTGNSISLTTTENFESRIRMHKDPVKVYDLCITNVDLRYIANQHCEKENIIEEFGVLSEERNYNGEPVTKNYARDRAIDDRKLKPMLNQAQRSYFLVENFIAFLTKTKNLNDSLFDVMDMKKIRDAVAAVHKARKDSIDAERKKAEELKKTAFRWPVNDQDDEYLNHGISYLVLGDNVANAVGVSFFKFGDANPNDIWSGTSISGYRFGKEDQAMFLNFEFAHKRIIGRHNSWIGLAIGTSIGDRIKQGSHNLVIFPTVDVGINLPLFKSLGLHISHQVGPWFSTTYPKFHLVNIASASLRLYSRN